MSDLTEFLLARISEDEATARAAFFEPDSEWDDPIEGKDTGWVKRESIVGDCGMDETTAAHMIKWSPARVLVECEAKRTLLFLSEHGCGDDYERVQRALALPYADHPDYLPKWKP